MPPVLYQTRLKTNAFQMVPQPLGAFGYVIGVRALTAYRREPQEFLQLRHEPGFVGIYVRNGVSRGGIFDLRFPIFDFQLSILKAFSIL
jgi:hypothetical protein